jgi:two-component sensor histidine kinase
MKKSISEFIQRCISIGVNDGNTAEFNDRLRIMNIFVWICILFCTPYYLLMGYFGYYNLSLLFVIVQTLFAFSFVSCQYGYYNSAKIIIILSTNYSILMLTFSFGYSAGFYLYYFSAPLIVFSLFHFKQTKFLAFGHLLYFSSLFISEFAREKGVLPLLPVDESLSNSVYLLNVFLALFFIIALAFSFSKYHSITYRLLADRNVELENNKTILEKVLKEKNILLSETHHRVKNNLAVISGLFDLQLMFNDDPKLSSVMNNSKTRIKSMSLVHESLYEQQDLSKIEFREYIERVVHEIEKSHNVNPNVRVILEVENLHFDLEKAIPLGLIINEALTNAFKHAFDPNHSGQINLSFIKTDNYQLKISDNGKGFPTTTPPKYSMGMTLIDALVKQLNGSYAIRNDQGTIFEVKFS